MRNDSVRPVLVSCVLCLLIVSAPALAADAVVLHEGTFSVADLAWTTQEDGSLRPQLAELRHLGATGQPDLPVAELLLLVPADRTVVGVELEPLAVHREFPPGPLAMTAPVELDSGELVRSPAPVGTATGWVTGWSSHLWQGYRLLSVQVSPLQPAEGGLEFLDAYALRVTYGAADPADMPLVRQRFVPGETESNQRVLGALVDNPERVFGYAREQGMVVTADKGFVPTPLPSLTGSAVRFVIITDEAMAPEFQRLADHKTLMGMPTVVVTRNFIAANYRNGADIQETMRMFIRDAYTLWGTEHVLLGGDSGILPPRYVNNPLYPAVGSTDIPVDLYFAGLDGNWNANGNAAYGEPLTVELASDDADFLEEVYVGRAPVNNPAEASIFVDKVIGYESAPPTADWANRALFAAEVLFPDDWAPGDAISLDGAGYPEQQVTELIEPCTDMEYTRMYQTFDENVGDAILTRAALIDTLNTGHYGIFNQIGHGYFFNMSVGDANFTNGDADNLVNGDHQFVIYALNCASAAFDYSCLMERFLQNANGGAVSAIGSVRAAFPVTSNNYQQEFFGQLYCQNEQVQGRLVALSRLPFIGSTEVNYTDRWTFENYTLLGDPTMAIWTGQPKALALSVPAVLDLGPQAVPVAVTEGGVPVAGATVCLTKGGEDYAVGTTDAAGMVSLDFLPVTAGDVVVTVSGRNLELTAVTIPVVPGAAYLAVSDAPIIDDGSEGSAGNGNGEVEAGETIAIYPVLSETGGSGATGISATLTVNEPGVTVLAANASFPDVSAGGAVTAISPFVFTVDPSVADGTPLLLEFDADDGVGTYRSEQKVTVKAPELEIVAVDWEDDTWGDGNGLISNGERVGLTFRAKNFGAGRADVITAYLRSDDGTLVLNDTLAAVSPLELMDESGGSPRFSQTILNASRNSVSRIVLVDNYGRTTTREITLQRPFAPTALSTDPSLGPDVIALSWEGSTSDDVSGYNVYRSQVASGPFVKVNADLVTGVTYFRDEGLEGLTTYYYRVETVSGGLVPSAPSLVVEQPTAPAEIASFPVGFNAETSSHLAVGDVDGDGDNEIVLAADELYVWHHDGSELADGDGNSQTLGPFTGLETTLTPAGVALGHLDDQPGLEMVFSEKVGAQLVHVMGRDGTDLPGWPRPMDGVPGERWNWAAPAIGDIDGDGDNEVIINTLNGRVWAWHHDGTEVRDGDANPATVGVFFFRPGADWEWSMGGPALYDLDGDGAKDIIFGTKSDATGTRRLMALRHDGSDVPGFPYVASGPIVCHPAVGDLNGDGMVEIVFYTTWNSVYAVQQDGSNYPGFPTGVGLTFNINWVSSPALGDLDDDGELEIVLAANHAGDSSHLTVVDTDIVGGTSGDVMSGWPVALPGSSEGSPVLGDINGDGGVDIVHGIGGGATTAPDNLYAFNADGSSHEGFPMTLGGPCMPSAVLTDIERDGDIDIVYGGWDLLVHVWDMPTAYDPLKVPWMTFQGDMQRSGVIFPLELVAVEDEGELPPAGFAVGSPYPNPFNPSTSVRLYVPADGDLELDVHDVRGRKVRTMHAGRIARGWHVMTWDGRDDAGRAQASGMYFMRARSEADVVIQKMTLVK